MDKKPVKIVTIGGGSSYTPELVEGFIKRYNELPVKELWLVDIEEGKEKLEIVGGLAKRMVKKAGLDIDIHLTLDRREALKDADFVTTQFRVGLLDAREKDELIPLKYNIIGQETNGPGGMFKALRTIPVIFDIIKDCEELCPNAWIVSFTNPSGINAEAVFRHTGWKKFIGLCNGPINMIKDIENILSIVRSYGVTVLDGKCETIEINGQKINICGVDDPDADIYLKDYKTIDEQLEYVDKISNKKYFTILMSHRPELYDKYATYDFDLVLSGHAHGGQWSIPFLLDGVYAPHQGIFPEYVGGQYDYDGGTMIVSRGLSRMSPPVPRIFNRPELLIIEVK